VGSADGPGLVLAGLVIVVGLVGIVVPILPGMLLVLAGMLVFAISVETPLGWALFVASLAVGAGGWVLKYKIPGARMSRQGVRTSTLVLAVLLAVVGFFVIPVVGAVIGFVGGIWLVELGRGRHAGQAWTRTKHALVAVLQSMGIELVTGLVVTTLFVIGVVTA
jgi:uncharacterized protein YqgC (DUF456 family)